MNSFCIGLFDSGVGGIKVLERVRKEYSACDFVYLFDKSGLPYGNKTTEELNGRALRAVNFLEKKGCNLIIFACNTQTIASLEYVKKRTKTKIYGVIPPIDTAINQGHSRILVMATPYTLSRKNSLKILPCDEDKIICAPQRSLAEIIECNLHKKEVIKNYIKNNLEIYKGKIDCVVLGCTHYYFLKKQIEDFFNVSVFDGIDVLMDSLDKCEIKNCNDIDGKVSFFYS